MTEPSGVHRRGVLDTSALILIDRIATVDLLPRLPLITAISLAELSVGPLIARDESERSRRLAHLQKVEATFSPIPFDVEAARAFGGVSASLRKAGRKVEARRKDAMIASIALARELPVYTCNPRDFEGIEGLEVVHIPIPA